MKQQFITIRPEDLLERVARFKKEGCRLVQILCTRTTEGFELTYTFDKNYFLPPASDRGAWRLRHEHHEPVLVRLCVGE